MAWSGGSPTSASSTRTFAYAELKGRLIGGEVPPGARISERSLSQALGVSRTPLREALLQLESETLVERTESGGWQVPRLSERDVRDIFAVRRQLEVLAIRFSIERASDHEVGGLELFLDASEDAYAAHDVVSMTGANGEFHTAVYRSAHSPWLEATIEPVRNQTIRIRFLIAGGVARPEYSEGHRQIFDAIAARNPRTAEAIMSDHVEDNLHVAIRHLDVLAGPTRSLRYPDDLPGATAQRPWSSRPDGAAIAVP